jgi:hypothetical protein
VEKSGKEIEALCDKSTVTSSIGNIYAYEVSLISLSISLRLTHYAFRNGSVEDMYTNAKLTQEDMKTINKYMVNRLAGILSATYNCKQINNMNA